MKAYNLSKKEKKELHKIYNKEIQSIIKKSPQIVEIESFKINLRKARNIFIIIFSIMALFGIIGTIYGLVASPSNYPLKDYIRMFVLPILFIPYLNLLLIPMLEESYLMESVKKHPEDLEDYVLLDVKDSQDIKKNEEIISLVKRLNKSKNFSKEMNEELFSILKNDSTSKDEKVETLNQIDFAEKSLKKF